MKKVYFYYLDNILERVYDAYTDEDVIEATLKIKKSHIVDEDNNSIISSKKKIGDIEGYTESEYIDSVVPSYMGYQLRSIFDWKHSHCRFNVTSKDIYELLRDDTEGAYLNEEDIEEVLSGRIDYDDYLNRLCKHVATCQFEIMMDDMQDKFEMFTKSKDNCMIDTD